MREWTRSRQKMAGQTHVVVRRQMVGRAPGQPDELRAGSRRLEIGCGRQTLVDRVGLRLSR